jgi:hypothetical protein
MEQEQPLSTREVEAMARQHATGQAWSSVAVNRKSYPLLSAMETLLGIIGWLVVAGGVGLFAVQVAPWITCVAGTGAQPQQGMMGGASCGVAALILAPMIGAFALGFLLIAFSEVIGVFRGIESNTHQLISSVEQAWSQIKLAGGEGQH